MDVTDSLTNSTLGELSFVSTTASSTDKYSDTGSLVNTTVSSTDSILHTEPLGNTTAFSTETYFHTGPLGVDHIVPMTFSALLSVFGTIGNVHCLVFYTKRFRQGSQPLYMKNSYHVFVISLAILDLFSSVFLLPVDIFDMSSEFTPHSGAGCALYRFLQHVVHISSVFHTSVISIHCWRQTCYPHSRQITAELAIKFCVAADIVAILPAIPTLILFGHSTQIKSGVSGPGCLISDDHDTSCIPLAYYAIIATFYAETLVIVACSYVALIYSRRKRMKTRKERKKDESNTTELKATEDQSQSQKVSPEEAQLRKTTWTLFIIVVIYFITYLYFMVFGAVIALGWTSPENLGPGSMSVYRILVRFPLLNHAVNPIVYGFRDEELRKRLKQIYLCKGKI